MSDRDHSPFAPAPAASPPIVKRTPEEVQKDILDQVAVQKLYTEGMYKQARHQSRFMWQLVEQARLQNEHLRETKTVIIIGLMILIAIAAMIGYFFIQTIS